MTNIMESPYTEDQLRAMSKDGKERIAGVVAVAWHQLVGHDQNAFEEALARRVTGTKYGLADLAVKLVGVVGEDLLLEVSGDVSMLLADYDLIMASEREEAGDVGSA